MCTLPISSADGSVMSQAATLTVYYGSGWPDDVTTVGQRQDYTFRRGVTYYIGSQVQLYGHTTIEPGAVIKFDYTHIYPCLQIFGTLDCKGGLYDPAVLTSIDDDTFGVIKSYDAPQPVL